MGSRLSSLAEYALRYSLAPSSLFLGLCCLCCRYVCDDVSKVTLPAWPGQGMDAIVIFRALSPICTLVRTRMLFFLSAVICILVLYLFGYWLVGVVVVYMFFWDLL